MADDTPAALDDERRAAPRAPMVLRVDYENSSDYLTSWTENVSAGGFFIRTDGPFEIGQGIEVTLSFPGLLEPLKVQGAVAWIRRRSKACPGGIGVRVDSDRGRRQLARVAMVATDRAHSTPDGGTYRVLLVEDNEFQRQACERVLDHLSRWSADKVALTMVHNGHEAVEIMKNETPDLMITDLYMPIMDGAVLIKTTREDLGFSDMPIIVVSGDPARREEVEPLGVDAFLEKPVKFADLLETIIYLIHLSSVADEG